jgi:hypothetical protein
MYFHWSALTAYCRIIASVHGVLPYTGANHDERAYPWQVHTEFGGKAPQVIASGVAPTQHLAVLAASEVVSQLLEE